ncbi:MAG TPA: histidine phosphatase family protein [Mesorhizobium sp.]|jgi:broad specificity phosphatase PhoE
MFPLVYFVRHGETDWNAGNRFQGQNEVDLNANGQAQAERNGRKLAELIRDPSVFDFVASPMRRTRETMELLRAAMGLPRDGYRQDSRLVEVHFGDWTGFTPDQLKQQDPEFKRRRRSDKWNIVPPGDGAESYQMLLLRMRPWFEELSQPTVCVTHGGGIRVAFRLLGGLGDDEAANMEVPQDKVLRLQDGALDWL